MTEPVPSSDQDEVVICQMARLGDLAQTLPLIEKLRTSRLTLICDAAAEAWARLLPGVAQVQALDTRRWRALGTGDLRSITQLLKDLSSEIPRSRSRPRRLLMLNDHPWTNTLAIFLDGAGADGWLTPEIILLRSYINLIAARQNLNRLHLADLWASLASGPARKSMQTIQPSERARQFADVHLGRKGGAHDPVWTILLGSGAAHRRIEPEIFGDWLLLFPAEDRPRIVLMGGPGEEPLGERFIRKGAARFKSVVNLIGRCAAEETIGVFAASEFVLGVDTGPLHWAAAAGCRVLGFYFGEAGFHSTGPYGDDHLVIAPDCAEYPCPPGRARQCQWQCRPNLEQTAVSQWLLHLARQRPFDQMPRLNGLQLHVSSMTEHGNHYAPCGANECTGEFEVYGQLVRRTLGNEIVMNPNLQGADHPDQWAQGIDLLQQLWQNEIEQLTLPAIVRRNRILELKSRARQRLADAFAPYKLDEHSASKRRLFSGQPAAIGA